MQWFRLTSPEHIQVKSPGQARSDFEEIQLLVSKGNVPLFTRVHVQTVTSLTSSEPEIRDGQDDPKTNKRGEKVTGRGEAENQMVVLNEVCKAGGRITLLLVTGTGLQKLKGPGVAPL